MKRIAYLIFSSTLFFSFYANANIENSKELQNIKNMADQLSQKQNDLQSDKKSDPNNRNIYKAWECRDMEDKGVRMTVVDITGIAKMNNIPSTEAALYGTKRPTASLPPCRVDLIVPPPLKP